MKELEMILKHLENKLKKIEDKYKKFGDRSTFDYSYYLGYKECLVNEIIYINKQLRNEK